MQEPARLAIAFGHLGDMFHGSQYQPGIDTVQGALESAVADLTWGPVPSEGVHSLRLASRTDAGVHVRMNVALLEMESRIWSNLGAERMVAAMNDHLPDGVWVWGVKDGGPEWNPRQPISRTYRYLLEGIEAWPGVETTQLEQWLSLFRGTHDLSNFAKPGATGDRIRTIERIEPWIVAGRAVGFEIEGPAFIWNQVRRIASAIEMLATDRCSFEDVERALSNPETPLDLGLAPPEWLVLSGMAFEGMAFEQVPEGEGGWSARPMDADERQQQHWLQVAQSDLKSWLMHQILDLRITNG